MATIREIRERFAGISKIKKITQAMQIVAATRLKKAEARVLEFRPYAELIKNIFLNVAAGSKEEHPLLVKRDFKSENTCVVAITSDRGLCGVFNDNIIRQLYDMQAMVNNRIVSLGKKGNAYFRRRKTKVIFEYADLNYNKIGETCQDLTKKIIDLYSKGAVSRVVLLFNKFRLNLLGRVDVQQVVPPVIQESQKVSDYIFEPEATAVLDRLIPAYIKTQIRASILESLAAEEMSRMVAMKYATDNADELIKKLNLDYHKARQAQITKEIIEVLGAES